MGDAKKNPRSDQYTGPLPDVVPGGDLIWLVEPNAAFKEKFKKLRDAGVTEPIKITEHERDVVLYARAIWGVPLHTVREVQTSVIPIEMARWTLVDFKRRHKANFEKMGMKHAADTIVLPDDEPSIIVT